ncbi:MAG: hypothetical protein L3J52_04785 [Proteobacteria bacterium]|nr:hypothetical protein [Pseudomonadota bacterium]
MLNKIIATTLIILLLLISTSLTANTTIPDTQRDIIISEVMTELGYYDAAEIEARVRLWKLVQPIPRASGETIASGSCADASCPPDASTGNLPKPRKVKVKGKIKNGKHTQNLKVRWKRPKKLPAGSSYEFKHYEIYLSFNGMSYEYFQVEPKYKNNGKLKKFQRIKFKGLEQGDYNVQLRAVYATTTSNTTSSLNKSSDGSGGSSWTNKKGIPVLPNSSTVSILLSEGVTDLYNCVIADGNTDTTVITSISNLICRTSGLGDIDVAYLTNFTGLVQLDLRKNYAITSIGLLSELPLLSWLHLAKITTITDLDSLQNFDSLETIYIKEMGLTQLPLLPESVTYINASFNNITDNAGGFFPTSALNTLVINSKADGTFGPGVTNSFISSLGSTAIETITAKNSQINNVSVFNSVQSLGNLNLNGSNLEPVQNIEAFGGFCSLTIGSSDVIAVKGHRPIEFFYANNLPSLELLEPLEAGAILETGFGGGAPENTLYFPLQTWLSGSNKLQCAHLDKAQANSSDPNVTTMYDMTVSYPSEYKNGNTIETLWSPICVVSYAASILDLPVNCSPNPPEMFNVFEDINTQTRFLSWTKDPDHDYTGWGVTHFKINALDSSGIAINEYIIDVNADSYYQINNFDAVSFEIVSCTSFQCGNKKTSGTIAQGLTRPTNTGHQWDTSNSNDYQFTVNFKYPQNVFDSTYGKPDYFLITPAFTQLPGGFTSLQILAGSVNNNCVSSCPNNEDIWQSAPISRDALIGDGLRIWACRND